ncbi:MAG: methyltransferase domain-containing protein [Promethearchaeota archaeon]|nr:MAG: methyltransferase domain-containing protein [Candidatus Lokiarchaeota archaeon]
MHIVIHIIIWSIVAALVWIFVIAKIARKIYPFPIPQIMVNLIDNRFRRKYIQNPDEIAQRMGAKPGDIVIELGPGKGFYSIGVAKRIEPDGKLYAIDIEQKILDRLQIRLNQKNITNIIPKKDNAHNLDFEDESVDLIFAVACLPEIPEPIEVLKEFKRILKPEGRISLCELFIDPDYPLRSTVRKWTVAAGLEVKEEFGSWFTYQLNIGKPAEK